MISKLEEFGIVDKIWIEINLNHVFSKPSFFLSCMFSVVLFKFSISWYWLLKFHIYVSRITRFCMDTICSISIYCWLLDACACLPPSLFHLFTDSTINEWIESIYYEVMWLSRHKHYTITNLQQSWDVCQFVHSYIQTTISIIFIGRSSWFIPLLVFRIYDIQPRCYWKEPEIVKKAYLYIIQLFPLKMVIKSFPGKT